MGADWLERVVACSNTASIACGDENYYYMATPILTD